MKTIDDKNNHIIKQVIKNNGLIISPVSVYDGSNISHGIGSPSGTRSSIHDIRRANVAKLLVAICDAIVICDMDRFSKDQAPYDSTRFKDPYLEYIHATQNDKKTYFVNSVYQPILDKLGVKGMSTPEIKAELDKLLYATVSK